MRVGGARTSETSRPMHAQTRTWAHARVQTLGAREASSEGCGRVVETAITHGEAKQGVQRGGAPTEQSMDRAPGVAHHFSTLTDDADAAAPVTPRLWQQQQQ